MLENSYKQIGDHRVEWFGTNNDGESVASGLYFYVFSVGSYRYSGKMMLMK